MKIKHWTEIDGLYALGILLVLMGHSHSSDWTKFQNTPLVSLIKFIYTFHMAMFIFIAGFLFQNNRADQGDQPVPVDLLPVRVRYGGPVTVRIKDDAPICSAVHHCLSQAVDGVRIFRIRNMVREHSVRLQELASFRVRTQVLQHGRVEPAGAVAGVHRNMQALQRLRILRSQTAADPVHRGCAFRAGASRAFRLYPGEAAVWLADLDSLCLPAGRGGVFRADLRGVPVGHAFLPVHRQLSYGQKGKKMLYKAEKLW